MYEIQLKQIGVHFHDVYWCFREFEMIWTCFTIVGAFSNCLYSPVDVMCDHELLPMTETLHMYSTTCLDVVVSIWGAEMKVSNNTHTYLVQLEVGTDTHCHELQHKPIVHHQHVVYRHICEFRVTWLYFDMVRYHSLIVWSTIYKLHYHKYIPMSEIMSIVFILYVHEMVIVKFEIYEVDLCNLWFWPNIVILPKIISKIRF